LRIIFAGTPEFARCALERLHGSGHTISLVLTQPDRPAGRGMKLQASAVKQFAVEQGIAVEQPRSLRLDGKFPEDASLARQAIARAQADVMVVAAYGLILPTWVFDDMTASGLGLGCLNIHGSLLPRWRGAAPIHRAIEAGDSQTGVTIMQMDEGLDTGDMLLARAVDIQPSHTTAQLHDVLADLGADLLVQALDMAAAGRLCRVPQPQEGVTYAHKVEKHEAAVHWQDAATAIVRKVHAFNPFPVANAVLQGEVLKIWEADCLDTAVEQATPGQVLAVSAAGIDVLAHQGVVRLTELQRPGGKRLPVADFLRGFDVQPGMCFAPHLPE
jgi:methionyl-tRNA formyltransferase